MYLSFDDVWLVGGARTPFADYNGVLRDNSATDLGIAAAKGALQRTDVSPDLIDVTVAGTVAQTSLDSYYLSRHIALYSGVGMQKPALTVNRICCSGFEAVSQAASAIQNGARAALAVGTESMSRNPIVAYGMRSGFRLGDVKFYDSLCETLRDPAPDAVMGQTAENLAQRYQLSRSDVDEFAADSFARAVAAQAKGYFKDEIVAFRSEMHHLEGYSDRRTVLPRGVTEHAVDNHIRETTLSQLAQLKPSFKGVQTAGNSSAIVDGAAAVVLTSGDIAQAQDMKRLAKIAAVAVEGVPPEVMGIGPAPAIRVLLERSGLSIADIGCIEVNEAFGAQALAVERELGIDHDRYNPNGGAIAIGHPLGATGVRCTLTAAREAQKRGERYAIAAACAGGGQGMAILLDLRG